MRARHRFQGVPKQHKHKDPGGTTEVAEIRLQNEGKCKRWQQPARHELEVYVARETPVTVRAGLHAASAMHRFCENTDAMEAVWTFHKYVSGDGWNTKV